MLVRRSHFECTITESQRASNACRTHAQSTVVTTVDGMNVCITGSHADETHGRRCGRRSSSRPCRTHRHTQDKHTQQSTVTTTTSTTKSVGGLQRPSSSSSLSWLRQERNQKQKFRQNRGTLLLTRWLVPSLATIATTQTTALVGYRNQWVAEEEHGPSNQARSVYRSTVNTHAYTRTSRVQRHAHDKGH